jgi:hypothetical protein
MQERHHDLQINDVFVLRFVCLVSSHAEICDGQADGVCASKIYPPFALLRSFSCLKLQLRWLTARLYKTTKNFLKLEEQSPCKWNPSWK